MTKSLEEANAGIRALEDEIIIIRHSPSSEKDMQARVNKVHDKLKILLRRTIEDLHPSFYKDNADIEEHIRIGISLSNHYARLNELIPENALEATSLAEHYNEVNDDLRELRKRNRGRVSAENHGKYFDQPLHALVPVHSSSPQVVHPVSVAQVSQRLRWLPVPEETYCIKDQEILFVNRDHAIEKLVKIHAHTSSLAYKQGEGSGFEIALIDNLVGAEKTAFAENYIRKSSNSLKTEEYSPEFVDSLSRARTVTVRLRPGMFGALFRDDAPGVMEKAVREAFVVAVESMIRKRELEGTTCFLTENLSLTSGFNQPILRFISETDTPLFLVFDEVGIAFEDDAFTLKEQRDCFLKFCSRILSPCLMLADFYLLLIGKADLLSLVSNRTPCSPSLSGSNVNITRIGLN